QEATGQLAFAAMVDARATMHEATVSADMGVLAAILEDERTRLTDICCRCMAVKMTKARRRRRRKAARSGGAPSERHRSQDAERRLPRAQSCSSGGRR